MSSTHTADQLSPRTLHRLGNTLERYGTAAVLVVSLSMVALLPVYPVRVLLGGLGTWGMAGVIAFLLGELLQEGAKQRRLDRGRDVPERWKRSDGTKHLAEKLAGDLLRTRVADLLARAPHYQRYVRFDRQAVALVGVMLAVQLLALAAISLGAVDGAPTSTVPDGGAGAALSGGALAAWIVVESLVIVAAVRVWKRLSERWRARLKRAAYLTAWGFVVFVYGGMALKALLLGHYASAILVAAFAVGAYYAVRYLLGNGGWIRHNALTIALAVFVTALVGVALPPIAAVVLLGALIVWDYAAVELSDLMLDIVEFSSSVRLPNYLVIPAARGVDLEAVQDWLGGDGERPEDVASIIGAGDFIVPSVLVVSVAIEHGPLGLATAATVAGVVLALGRLRAVLDARAEALPALPWVNGGAIGGYAVGLVTLWVIPA